MNGHLGLIHATLPATVDLRVVVVRGIVRELQHAGAVPQEDLVVTAIPALPCHATVVDLGGGIIDGVVRELQDVRPVPEEDLLVRSCSDPDPGQAA
ncbi:MAG: hypothetical protein IH919_03465, partial [Deltaproteobacteria bacterium]|nr:hypothetical protein [Deltaproteobacteria bacterium]